MTGTEAKKYDYAVFIGRFSPLHSGHVHVAREALKIADRLIMVVGSADKPRDIRNPYTFGERKAIIEEALWAEMSDIVVIPQVDHTYNDEKWIASIQASVSTIVTTQRGWTDYPAKICIVGFEKDHSTYYMKKFPLWDVVEIAPANRWSATEVRNMLLDIDCRPLFDTSWSVSKDHYNAVIQPLKEGKLDKVVDEFKIIQEYKKSWELSPYPVAFQTVDAIVTQSGHILLVQRKAAPGEGLWALPGGYIQMTEKLVDAMLRELDEETKIKVPKAVLAGSIVKAETYDDPYRSVRGRTITRAYHIKLADQEKLPKIKGSDDARDAKWFQLSEFMKMRSVMFEDHYCLTCHMLGL